MVRATRVVSSCFDRSARSVVLLAAVMALAVAVRPRASSWELMVATRAVTAAMAESICARTRAGRVEVCCAAAPVDWLAESSARERSAVMAEMAVRSWVRLAHKAGVTIQCIANPWFKGT